MASTRLKRSALRLFLTSFFIFPSLVVVFQNCSGFKTADLASLSAQGAGGGLGSVPESAAKTPYGLNLDFNIQSLIDLIQPTTTLNAFNGATLIGDAQGWPQQDFEFFMDHRYTLSWINGAVNLDPLKYTTDISGNYTLVFKGQATLSAWGGPTINNIVYNSATNQTTAQVSIPPVSTGIMFGIDFKQTKRNPSDSPGNGLTDVHLYLPGYGPTSASAFTESWLHQIRDFQWSALRYMGATGTSDYGQPSSNEAYPYLLNWATDRVSPRRGPLYASSHPGNHGIPWEYVVQSANETNRDPWINVPVNASDDYILQLAKFFHQNLHSNAIIYVEYSNEMWHLGFPQGPWNKQAAIDEVNSGRSNLNYDNVGNADLWRFRRIAKRTIEINRIFKSVFSDRPDRIRTVINNAWAGFYTDMLDYVSANYGSPANDIYAIAVTGYYNSANTTSADNIINGEIQMSNTSNRAVYVQTKAIATFYGLHMFVYEGGEGEVSSVMAGTPADPDLNAKFAASRDPRMQQVVTNDLLNNWYPAGGDLYMQFSQVSGYSIYGFWGLSEDLNSMSTGKWLGAKQVLSALRPAMTMMTTLPTSSGNSVNIPEALPANQNWTMPSHQPWLEVTIDAPVSGNYSIQVQGLQTQPGSMPLMVDNRLYGNVTLPTQGSSSLSNAVNVSLSAGVHSIFVYGPSGAGASCVTITPSDSMLIRKN